MRLSYYRLTFTAIAFAALSQADVIYDVTNTSNGATAQADVSFGTNTMTVTVINTTVNPGDVSYNVSALHFDVVGATGISLSSSSASGFRTVNGGGTFSDAAGGTSGWVFTNPSAGTFQVDDLVGSGHAGPAQTLIGSAGSGGTYSNANGSIAGNGPHNPFIYSTVTFDFTFTGGVTANSTLSSIGFQFGTTDGTNIFTGDPQSSTPEPASYLMLTAGLGLLGLARKYRQ